MKEKSSLLTPNAQSLEMMKNQRTRERKLVNDFVIQQSHAFQQISSQPSSPEPLSTPTERDLRPSRTVWQQLQQAFGKAFRLSRRAAKVRRED